MGRIISKKSRLRGGELADADAADLWLQADAQPKPDPRRQKTRQGQDVRGLSDEYVGRTGTVTEAIAPPKTGRVLLGDAEWTATADAPISAGADVTVVAQRNLTMAVRPL